MGGQGFDGLPSVAGSILDPVDASVPSVVRLLVMGSMDLEFRALPKEDISWCLGTAQNCECHLAVQCWGVFAVEPVD